MPGAIETKPSLPTRAWRLTVREVREIAPAVVFFFIGFNMVLLTKQLFLNAYLITLADLMLAAVSALIAGKVVLIGDAIPLTRRYENAPLVYSILYKTAFYVVLVFFARLIEAGIPFIGHGGLDAFLNHLLTIFSWSRFIATQIWIIVLFAVYVTGAELARLFGDGELHKIFFTRRSSDLALTRRQRFRQMVRLHHLTDEHTIEEFRDPNTAAHREMIAIIRRLTREKPLKES
jgi:hypothetical protein